MSFQLFNKLHTLTIYPYPYAYKQLGRRLPNPFRELPCISVVYTDKRQGFAMLCDICDIKEVRGIQENGSGDVVSAVYYTVYTIHLSLCIQTAGTTYPLTLLVSCPVFQQCTLINDKGFMQCFVI